MTYEQKAAAEAAALASPYNAQPGQASPCAAVPGPAMPSHGGAQRYHEKLGRVLDRMGGAYTINDLLTRIYDGRMQSFAHRNSWLVAEINQFPRAKMMDWLIIVGDLEDCGVLHDRAIDFAREHDVPLIRAFGRRGWMPDARERGWRPITTNVVYHKDL